MRVKRVGLEHHRQPAFRGRKLCRIRPVDEDLARGGILQPRDQSQKRGLAAARGADEDHEFPVLDLKIQGRDDADIAEALFDFLKADLAHSRPPYFTAPKVRPRTSCFWLNQPRIRIGRKAMTEAAESFA